MSEQESGVAQVLSDTVAQDMKVLAQDAREKAKALTDENEEVCLCARAAAHSEEGCTL